MMIKRRNKIEIRHFILLLLGFCCSGMVAQERQTEPHTDVNAAISIGHRAADSLKVTALNLGLAGVTDSLQGIQLNLFNSIVHNDMRGMQISGIINGARNVKGVQLAGLTNVGIHVKGVQLAFLNNITVRPLHGIQLAAITNSATEVRKGLQVAGVTNISSSYMRGVQVAPGNYADSLNGSQIGIVNVAKRLPKGWQIGLVNYTQDTVAHKIGLVNINPKTHIDYLFFMGNSSVFNVAVRFRNNSTYNILGFGTHYMGLDKRFSGALYYRVGQYFRLSPRWNIGGDIGFYHIETFERNSSARGTRLYSYQGHVNLDYQLNKTVGLFASAGYGDTRYYKRGREYKHGFIGQAGLSLHYSRPSTFYTRKRMPDEPLLTDSVFGKYAFETSDYRTKHPWLAAGEVFGINLLVNSFDRFILNEAFAKVSFKTFRENVKYGFVWDNDQFSTNLFAHPYHGNLYFNSAHSNGLNFWESAPYAFGGSLMWEFAGEREPAAINDLMATTFGGICIGEIMHRSSELILNDRVRGFPRFIRELTAFLINPVLGFNRLVKGQAWRVRGDHYLYHDFNRLPVDFSLSAGNRYLADEGALFRGEGQPYFRFRMEYGDVLDTEDNKPYDYFTADMSVGFTGNQPIVNGVHLLGHIWSTPVRTAPQVNTVFGIFQHFNYYDSKPVKNGSSQTPYRISEAASFGPGLVYCFQSKGGISRLEQRVFLSGILLGGTKSDYYNVIDRDYNMGSGFSVKLNTITVFRNNCSFILQADYYRIFTWKGYEGKDLAHVDPLYLNAQGDKSNAQLFVINPALRLPVSKVLSLELSSGYFLRRTRYSYHPDVRSHTFEIRCGLAYAL